ncbi:MAG: archease [Candidatus Omnitrophota bacterium]|nr:archease [Candidatus Omnitrophota bacterium]
MIEDRSTYPNGHDQLKAHILTGTNNSKPKSRGYELIDHTADIGIKAYGKNLKKLFVNAACGMFGILADLKNVRKEKEVEIKLEAPDVEELFLLWLGELLYQLNGKGIILKEFLIEELTGKRLVARVTGEKLNLKRHCLKTEIKAVTYHGLKVRKIKDAWQAEVIFDV